MMVTGADDNLPLEVCGCWLIRDEISHLIKANDDAEFYTWTKVATPVSATRSVASRPRASCSTENVSTSRSTRPETGSRGGSEAWRALMTLRCCPSDATEAAYGLARRGQRGVQCSCRTSGACWHRRARGVVNLLSYLCMQPLHRPRDTGVIESPPPSCTKVAQKKGANSNNFHGSSMEVPWKFCATFVHSCTNHRVR